MSTESKERKVVHIAATPESGRNFECLYALCDDGTVWHYTFGTDAQQQWCRVPAIPQGEVPA